MSLGTTEVTYRRKVRRSVSPPATPSSLALQIKDEVCSSAGGETNSNNLAKFRFTTVNTSAHSAALRAQRYGPPLEICEHGQELSLLSGDPALKAALSRVVLPQQQPGMN